MEATDDDFREDNVDATCFVDRGTRWGVVITDGGGKFMFDGVRRSRIQWNPEEAEAIAIDFGLDLAHKFALREIEMESDCQGVIQQLQWEEEREIEIGLVCAEIRAKARTLDCVKWSFTGRN
ncbi:unnamed protein product [Linum trigynum]|uniref:RNase H type-1 domain-containing protein n=1 Tax=Linum trigynum TaxID=586398 RepID=A0AAV2EDS2_9ROSI